MFFWSANIANKIIPKDFIKLCKTWGATFVVPHLSPFRVETEKYVTVSLQQLFFFNYCRGTFKTKQFRETEEVSFSTAIVDLHQNFFKVTTLCVPSRDSISRPTAPASSVADRDDTTRPRRQGMNQNFLANEKLVKQLTCSGLSQDGQVGWVHSEKKMFCVYFPVPVNT
jgi:hypothetical protein